MEKGFMTQWTSLAAYFQNTFIQRTPLDGCFWKLRDIIEFEQVNVIWVWVASRALSRDYRAVHAAQRFFESWTTAKFGNTKETSQVFTGILFTAEVHKCSESQ